MIARVIARRQTGGHFQIETNHAAFGSASPQASNALNKAAC